MTIEQLDKIYDFVANILRLTWYALLGYFLIALIAPSMSFPNAVSTVAGFMFVDVPSIIFNFFLEISKSVDKLYIRGDSSTQWAAWTSMIIGIFALAAALVYYALLFVIFAISFASDDEANHVLENETMWLLGLVSNKEIIDAKVNANAIVEALDRRK